MAPATRGPAVQSGLSDGTIGQLPALGTVWGWGQEGQYVLIFQLIATSKTIHFPLFFPFPIYGTLTLYAC